MSESKYQAKLIKQYEADGWYVIKLITTNRNGIPDLILIKPKEVRLVEVKASNGKISELQKYRIKELENLGFNVSIEYEK